MENEIIDLIEKKKNKVNSKLKEYKELSYIQKYDKYDKELDDLIIDIKNEDIDIILGYTSSIFFKLCIETTDPQLENLENKLSKLYHKLKNLHFFNIMISLYDKITKIIPEIQKFSIQYMIMQKITKKYIKHLD